MTQLSPKPTSQNNLNGRGAYPQPMPMPGGTSAMSYPPSSPGLMPPYPGQNALKWALPEGVGQINPIQTYRPQKKSPFRWLSASLRVKALVLAIALGTLPLVSTGVISYFSTSERIKQDSLESEQVNIQDLADKLTLYLNERYGDIQAMSELAIFTNPKVRDKLTAQEKAQILDRYATSYGVYDSIAVFDLQGNVIAQSQSEPLGNHADRDYFQTVLKTNQALLAEPRVSETTKEIAFYTAAPIKDAVTGKTIGIIRARIPGKTIQAVFGVQSGRGQDFYAFDSSNKIFATSKPEFLGQTLEKTFPKLATQVKQVGRRDQNAITFNDELKQELVQTYNPTQRLEEQYGLKWSLVVATPASRVFASREQLLFTILSGTGVTILAVGAIATFIANRATKPILDAANTVDKIGQGDLDSRMEVQGEDELAVLGSNINQMASQLGTFVQEQALLAKITGSRAFNLEDLEDLFKDALDNARQILNCDRVILYRINPTGNGYISSESVTMGWPRAFNNKTEEPYIPEPLLESYKEGRVVATNNVFVADLYPEQIRFMERLQVKASLEVPILHEGQLYALLIAQHCASPHEWQPTQVNFAKQLAAQMGLSTDRVLLLQETEQLAQEQRQLKEGLQHRALELLKEVDPISKGDLTIRARVTADEIGTIADSYNATVGNLRKIVTQVQQAATQVAETTADNEATVQSLSVEALRQAEEIAQALNKAQQMAESVRQVAENAQQAELAVKQASETVEEGETAMNRTVEGILAIRETVAETAKKVKHLGESSQKISTVVNLISTFAAQTNLLALNASIEAARAGEEGRGFAVVADEVRALARQSAEATSEIEKLVAAIQSETNEVVAAMEAGTEQVVVGTKLVDETRNSLNKITSVSLQINQLVESITQATIVQSQASEAVTQTMTNVATIADKTSKEASHVSSSFEQLLKVAQALQADVGQFKIS